MAPAASMPANTRKMMTKVKRRFTASSPRDRQPSMILQGWLFERASRPASSPAFSPISSDRRRAPQQTTIPARPPSPTLAAIRSRRSDERLQAILAARRGSEALLLTLAVHGAWHPSALLAVANASQVDNANRPGRLHRDAAGPDTIQ